MEKVIRQFEIVSLNDVDNIFRNLYVAYCVYMDCSYCCVLGIKENIWQQTMCGHTDGTLPILSLYDAISYCLWLVITVPCTSVSHVFLTRLASFEMSSTSFASNNKTLTPL